MRPVFGVLLLLYVCATAAVTNNQRRTSADGLIVGSIYDLTESPEPTQPSEDSDDIHFVHLPDGDNDDDSQKVSAGRHAKHSARHAASAAAVDLSEGSIKLSAHAKVVAARDDSTPLVEVKGVLGDDDSLLGTLPLELEEEQKEMNRVTATVDGERAKLSGAESAEVTDEKAAEKAKDKVILNQKTLIAALENARDDEERGMKHQQSIIDELTTKLREAEASAGKGERATGEAKALKAKVDQLTKSLADKKLEASQLAAKVAGLASENAGLEKRVADVAREEEENMKSSEKENEGVERERDDVELMKKQAEDDEEDVQKQRKDYEDKMTAVQMEKQANDQEKSNLDETMKSLEEREKKVNEEEQQMQQDREDLAREAARSVPVPLPPAPPTAPAKEAKGGWWWSDAIKAAAKRVTDKLRGHGTTSEGRVGGAELDENKVTDASSSARIVPCVVAVAAALAGTYLM